MKHCALTNACPNSLAVPCKMTKSEKDNSVQFWLLLPDLIVSLMRLKPRYGLYSAFLMNIFFALKGSKLFILIRLLHTASGNLF